MPRPYWTIVTPVLAAVLLGATWGRDPGGVVLAVVAALLVGAVLAAVHHAEVVAHRVGEPLALGLDDVQIVLLFLTVVVGILTVVPGRAKPLQGGLHLVLLASFIFLTIAP